AARRGQRRLTEHGKKREEQNQNGFERAHLFFESRCSRKDAKARRKKSSLGGFAPLREIFRIKFFMGIKPRLVRANRGWRSASRAHRCKVHIRRSANPRFVQWGCLSEKY